MIATRNRIDGRWIGRCVVTGAALGMLAMFGAGCGAAKTPSTVQDLADALRAGGVTYQSTGRSELPAKVKHARIDESLVLAGENLNVEILRIEDERTFKLFRSSVMLLIAAEAKVGQALPGRPPVYVHRPFVVIVRQEPQAGQVKAALSRVWPDLQEQVDEGAGGMSETNPG